MEKDARSVHVSPRTYEAIIAQGYDLNNLVVNKFMPDDVAYIMQDSKPPNYKPVAFEYEMSSESRMRRGWIKSNKGMNDND